MTAFIPEEKGTVVSDPFEALPLKTKEGINEVWFDLVTRGLLDDSLLIVYPDRSVGAAIRSETIENMRKQPECPGSLPDKLSQHPPQGRGYLWVLIFEPPSTHVTPFGLTMEEIERGKQEHHQGLGRAGWGMGKRGGTVIRGDN